MGEGVGGSLVTLYRQVGQEIELPELKVSRKVREPSD